MQRTSQAYKTEQNNHLRNEQYVYVYLGVVSKEAQSNATSEGTFTAYSDEQKIFSNVPFEAYYETAEPNFARTDGSQYFMPRDRRTFALYQGAVTKDLLGSIKFTFGSYKRLNIRGLTINFGDYYPTEFTITNGHVNNTYTYTNDKPGQFVTEDMFLNTEFIQITPTAMVNGNKRLRIMSIMFGVGFMFDNYNLISTSCKFDVAHLSDSLPSKTFTFTIDNLNKKFSADNPESWVAFLQEQQEISFQYGRRLDDGTIYKIPGGKMNLKSWSSNDTQAKFTAVGNLDYITTTYTKGRYYESGISLYDLAVDVLQDAGIENYRLDAYLKRVKTHNPLPVETHKNLLQLIANAARSILFEDRNGVITIQNSFMPDLIDISSNGHLPYSFLEGLVQKDVDYNEYATTEENFTTTNTRQFFMPRNKQYGVTAGYVSGAVSNSSGYFTGQASNFIRFVTDDDTITGIEFDGDISTEKGKFIANGITVDFNEETDFNPMLTITWEAAWTFFNLTLVFSDVHPKNMIITAYNDGEVVDTIEVDDIEMSTLIEHGFYAIDQLRFEFVRTNAYQRIHLGKILFGDISDYTLLYQDLSSSPIASKTDFVKNINVVYSEYTYGTEKKNIGTVAVVEETNTISYRTAYHDYSVEYKEIPDDETNYTKVSNVFCDELPSVDDAKTGTRYFVRKTSGYKMYILQSEENVKSWELLGNVTETISDEMPSVFAANKLYLVKTNTNLIYHLYMLDDTGTESQIISLGYDVRGTLSIIDSGAYYVTFTSNVSSPVNVSGIAFLIDERTYTNELNELGIDKTANNVLIDNIEHAVEESQWLAEYYGNDVTYKLQYRGEPALDPDDQIYLENRFVEKNLIRITNTQIDTSTGMSMNCILNARRISYARDDVARVDYAIVDVSKVGQ